MLIFPQTVVGAGNVIIFKSSGILLKKNETVPKNCVLPYLSRFNCLIDLNPLDENQCKLKAYQQISLAVKIVYHTCDITFLLC